jgi:hypothetical protein
MPKKTPSGQLKVEPVASDDNFERQLIEALARLVVGLGEIRDLVVGLDEKVGSIDSRLEGVEQK